MSHIPTYFPIASTIEAGNLLIPTLESNQAGMIEINAPAFLFNLNAPITTIQVSLDKQQVFITATIDETVLARLTLRGIIENNHIFQTQESLLDLIVTEDVAKGDFIALTLKALLALAGETTLHIPRLGLKLKLNFQVPLKSISDILQKQQTAYRLMVIECATGITFQLPSEYSGKEIRDITFIYRAITDRTFVWPNPEMTITVEMPATQEQLSKMPRQLIVEDIHLDPMVVEKHLLGHTIHLGKQKLVIKDGVLKDFDWVLQNLAIDDGHIVPAVFISATGQYLFSFPEAPQLLDKPWDSLIQHLIDIEPYLYQQLSDSYNALAASTFSGLTEEEIAEITARPQNEDANE